MPTGQPATAELDARYGRTPARRRWNRRGAWAAGSVFLLVVAAWVVWANPASTTAAVDAVDTGFTIVDDTSVNVTWRISLPPGESARCALQAQNEAHSIVGWKIVDVAASDQRSRGFTELINTTELAVTGLIYRCWLA